MRASIILVEVGALGLVGKWSNRLTETILVADAIWKTNKNALKITTHIKKSFINVNGL